MSKLGKEGNKQGNFCYPQSTECDNAGKMLVVDQMCRMQMFDKNGKFLKSVGTKGRGQLQFMGPVSMAISQDKQVFICERENHRIQVLDKELTFQRFIGERGQNECEFYFPSGIVISDGGHNQVVSLDGTFVRSHWQALSPFSHMHRLAWRVCHGGAWRATMCLGVHSKRGFHPEHWGEGVMPGTVFVSLGRGD